MTRATPRLPRSPFLYPILDASLRGRRSLSEWVGLVTGPDRASVVQWRFKGLDDTTALEGAREVREATRSSGVLFIVNDRPDIARLVDADGVHLGQDDVNPADARAILPDGVIGVSTHNEAQFIEALSMPVDYIAVGPIFQTASKQNPDPVVGPEFVAWAQARAAIPIVAIGGITVANADAVVKAGASGIAVISELMKNPKPDDAARAFAAAILRSSAR